MLIKIMDRLLNILLVEDELDVCKRFKAEINETLDMALIDITNNSYRALELVNEYTPDVVILDLELHLGRGNGLYFLRGIKNLRIPFLPYILIVTNNSSPTTYQFARELGADFIMYKHQEGYSEGRVIEFLDMMRSIIQSKQKSSNPLRTTTETAAQKRQRLRRVINTELNYIGINPKSVGFLYLTDAILIAAEDMLPNVTLLISEKYKKTPASVERAMQNAINRAWRTTDITNLLLHYTAKIHSSKGVPTINEFVRYYGNKVRSEH